MAFDTLNEFVLFLLVPHYLTYYIYIAVKYVPLIIACWPILRCKRVRPIVRYDLIDVVLLLIAFLWCCCCCCYRETYKSSWNKAKYFRSILDRSLIKLLLGRQEGVVERFNIYESNELDDNNLPTVYIRNKQLAAYEVKLLALLIITFGLLTAITAFDLYFLDVTYTCTDNPEIYCFVTRQYPSADGSELDLNITNARITDCQYWKTGNISGTVAFKCFRWAYNSEITLAAVGSLITLFVIAVKITTGMLITLFEIRLAKSRNKDTTTRYIKRARIGFAVFTGVVEVTLALSFGVAFVFLLINEETNGNMFTKFFRKHGNQFILIFGILASCLLLPLEDYARSSIDHSGYQLLPRRTTSNQSVVDANANRVLVSDS